jgi:hypothetical protein
LPVSLVRVMVRARLRVACPKKFWELVLKRTKPGPVGWLKMLVRLRVRVRVSEDAGEG